MPARSREHRRVLGDEVDANALGTDQAHHLFHLFDKRLGSIGEEQVCLVEEEDQFRLFRIADFRQLLEEFRQHPEQIHRVKPRGGHELVGGQNVDDPAAVRMKSRMSRAGSPKKFSPP